MTESADSPERYTDADRQALLGQYDRANALIETVQKTHAAGTQTSRGKRYLDDSIMQSMGPISDNSQIIKALREAYDLPYESLVKMYESFEEVARRNDVVISDADRPAVYKRLAVMLQANMLAFDIPPKNANDFVAATYLNGDLTTFADRHINSDTSQPTYAEYFSDSPWVIKYALTGYPSAPDKFLDGVVKTLSELPEKHIKDDPSQPKYGDYFKDAPFVLKNAAVRHAKDSCKFLDSLVDRIEKITNAHIGRDPKNLTYGEYFKDDPWVIRYAASNTPKRTEEALDDIIEKIATLPKKHIDDDPTKRTFGEYFLTDPWVIKYAAVNSPRKTLNALNDIVDRIEELLVTHIDDDPAKPTFGEFFEDTPASLRYIAIHRPSQTKTALNRVAATMAELPKKYISNDPSLPKYEEYFPLSDIKFAAATYSPDTATFLDNAYKKSEKLKKYTY